MDPNNYRPITTLSVISKIFEKVINFQLNQHLQQNNIISSRQYGFLNGSSTSNACVELTHFITTAMNKKSYVSCLFLDLVKAFDLVDHDILIQKLLSIGVCSEDISLYRDFICFRHQYVCVNGELSSCETSSFGVPQGSVLGPTLFNIYINDVSKLNLNGDIQMYADDLVIKYDTVSLDVLFDSMNEDLETIQRWLNFNKLILNVNKSKYILFGNHVFDFECIDTNYKLIANNQIIERVSDFKYLGLYINYQLKWNSHIEHIKSKIVPYIFTLKKLQTIVPKHSLEKIYYSYIHTHFMYLNVIWCHSIKSSIEVLYKLQKRAVKYIECVNLSYPSEMLFTANIKSIYFVSVEELLIYTYKIVNNLIKHNYEPTTIQNIHNHNTRRRSQFHIENFHSQISRSNVYYKGFNLFNKLPRDIRHQATIQSFKEQLSKHLKLKLRDYISIFNQL